MNGFKVHISLLLVFFDAADVRHDLHVAALEGCNEGLQIFKLTLSGTFLLRLLRVMLLWFVGRRLHVDRP